MNQHEFVKGCLLFYEQEGMTPEKDWDKAHYPAPKGVGTETIWLTHEHHQIQGLLQSEEYNQVCFFSGDTKKFLLQGPFMLGWAKLWDLYDKWSGNNGTRMAETLHAEKDEMGRSVAGVEAGRRMSTITHAEKDEFGRSLHALKAFKGVHDKKDETGRSLLGLRCAEKAHCNKDEMGRSILGVKLAEEINGQRWKCTETGHVSTPGGLSRYQSARDIDTKKRIRVE